MRIERKLRSLHGQDRSGDTDLKVIVGHVQDLTLSGLQVTTIVQKFKQESIRWKRSLMSLSWEDMPVVKHLPPLAWAVETILLTFDTNALAKMSCNPAIGGVAKGRPGP